MVTITKRTNRLDVLMEAYDLIDEGKMSIITHWQDPRGKNVVKSLIAIEKLLAEEIHTLERGLR